MPFTNSNFLSFSLAFSLSTGIVKKLFKTIRNKKKKKHGKIVISARSKLNSIESKISETLTKKEISHEDFLTIINEGKNYRELKESARIMNSRKSNTEKISLIEGGKKIDIDKIIKSKKIINSSLMSKI